MSDTEQLQAGELRPGVTIWNPNPGKYPENSPSLTSLDVTGVTELNDGRVAIFTLQGRAPLIWAADNTVALFSQEDAALVGDLTTLEQQLWSSTELIDHELVNAGLPGVSTLRAEESVASAELRVVVRELIDTATQAAELHALLRDRTQPRRGHALRPLTELQRNLDIQARKYRVISSETA